MKNNQHSKSKMYIGIFNFLNNHIAVWDSYTFMHDAVNRLNAYIDAISLNYDNERSAKTSGSEDKRAKRIKLEEEMLTMAGLVKAYAGITNNQVLFNDIKLTKSNLKKRREKILVYDAKMLLSLITEHSAGLANYGMTPAMITGYEQKINTFDDMINVPAENLKVTKEKTANLRTIIKEADYLLDVEMDGHMNLFKADDIFYSTYKTLRRPQHVPYTKLAMKISVIDAATQLPLQGALIKIRDHRILRKTSPKGKIHISNLKEGKHKILVRLKGYEPAEPVIVNSKEGTSLATVEMTALA